MKLRLFISELDCFQSYAWQWLVDLRLQEPVRWKWWGERYTVPGPPAIDILENFCAKEEKVEGGHWSFAKSCPIEIDWYTTLPWMLVESQDLACIQILNSIQKNQVWCIWTLTRTRWALSLASCWDVEDVVNACRDPITSELLRSADFFPVVNDFLNTSRFPLREVWKPLFDRVKECLFLSSTIELCHAVLT